MRKLKKRNYANIRNKNMPDTDRKRKNRTDEKLLLKKKNKFWII